MRVLALCLLIVAGGAHADTADLDALSLADGMPASAERASDWRLFAETSVGRVRMRGSDTSTASQRLSLDLSYEGALAPGWRMVFADRVDLSWQERSAGRTAVNTLKEAYLSWQIRQDQIVDIGRVNARYGVATGYNPTDFFRSGALRSVTSADPASLRRNRLGSVMLRGQTLWTGGGLTALYAPRLADHPSDASFSADFGATNSQNRWLVSLTQQVTEGFSPQVSVYGEEHASPQFGLNLTGLVGNAMVLFAEGAMGRSRSLYSEALDHRDDSRVRARIAAGLTYTLTGKLSLTAEYERNDAGLDRDEWDALRRGPTATYLQYRKWAAFMQEIPVKRAAFMYASWQDAFMPRLDLSALMRINLVDRSRTAWMEARYHWDRVDLAVQWQLNLGQDMSEYGASQQKRALQATVVYFF